MKNNDKKDHASKNLMLFILFWLGVLTGAVAAIMYMQAVNTTDLKSDVLYTPVEYSVPGTYKPGPTPWMPSFYLDI